MRFPCHKKRQAIPNSPLGQLSAPFFVVGLREQAPSILSGVNSTDSGLQCSELVVPGSPSISNLELTLYKTPIDSIPCYLDRGAVAPAVTDIVGAQQNNLLLNHCLTCALSPKSKTTQIFISETKTIFWAINKLILQVFAF